MLLTLNLQNITDAAICWTCGKVSTSVRKIVLSALLDQESGFFQNSCSPVALLHSWKCELGVFCKPTELEVSDPDDDLGWYGSTKRPHTCAVLLMRLVL